MQLTYDDLSQTFLSLKRRESKCRENQPRCYPLQSRVSSFRLQGLKWCGDKSTRALQISDTRVFSSLSFWPTRLGKRINAHRYIRHKSDNQAQKRLAGNYLATTNRQKPNSSTAERKSTNGGGVSHPFMTTSITTTEARQGTSAYAYEAGAQQTLKATKPFCSYGNHRNSGCRCCCCCRRPCRSGWQRLGGISKRSLWAAAFLLQPLLFLLLVRDAPSSPSSRLSMPRRGSAVFHYSRIHPRTLAGSPSGSVQFLFLYDLSRSSLRFPFSLGMCSLSPPFPASGSRRSPASPSNFLEDIVPLSAPSRLTDELAAASIGFRPPSRGACKVYRLGE